MKITAMVQESVWRHNFTNPYPKTELDASTIKALAQEYLDYIREKSPTASALRTKCRRISFFWV